MNHLNIQITNEKKKETNAFIQVKLDYQKCLCYKLEN